MINLLPPELKQDYYYAHRNVRLVHWVVTFGLSFVLLIVISTAGVIYLHQLSESYLTEISAKQSSLSKQNLTATQTQVKDVTNSLKLAVQVLSKEVLFSKLLAQLATVTPANVSLTDLSITDTKGGISLTAGATDYAAATQFQVNITDPNNKIFAVADINGIICDGRNPKYPCNATYRALFVTNNPFLFINAGGKS